MIWFVGLLAAGWVTSLVCFVICLGLPGRLAVGFGFCLIWWVHLEGVVVVLPREGGWVLDLDLW